MLVCPACPKCGCESEYEGRDSLYYYFGCSCSIGVYVISIPRDGSFDCLHGEKL